MPQTYAQIQDQIAKLQSEAKTLRQSEVAGVIAKIKDAIAAYGLTERDLFGGRVSGPRTRAPSSRQAKYSDGRGGEWGGRGPRPQWLRDALASGRSLEDFAIGSTASAAPSSAPAPRRAAKKAAKSKRGSRARYSDGVNSWSGFGRKPGWLVDALAGGKRLEDFQA